MNRSIESRAAAYKKSRKKRKALRMTVTYLAAIVVFCTVYALILPAITKERTAFCGYEEHIHTEECYSISYPICEICGRPFSPEDNSLMLTGSTDSSAADGEAAVSADGEIDTADGEAAASTDSEVGTADGEATASTDGEVGTADGEAAVSTDGEVGTADGEETEATEGGTVTAEHTEATDLESEGEAADETEGADTGDEDTSLDDHVHTAANNTVTTILTCTKTEHTHTEVCFVDREADVENAQIWEATLPDELTGNWHTDIIKTAESQLGYNESATNYEPDENGNTNGYSRYGAWDNEPYAPWKNSFVRFLLHYSGFDEEYFPVSRDTAEWIELLEEKGLYVKKGEGLYKTGDLVFLESADGEMYPAVLCELITDNDGSTILKVIEGDCNGIVSYMEYKLSDSAVLGFSDTSSAYTEYRRFVPYEKVYCGDDVTVTAKYYITAGIPEAAVLTVTPIEKTNEQYESCYTEAVDKINKNTAESKNSDIADFRLYDISFILDGEEIAPLDEVSVQISYPSKTDGDSDVSVIHYADDGPELSEVNDFYVDEDGNLTTEFETESFSLFAVVTINNSPNYIVTFSKYSITSTNISQLDGMTFAIGQDALALYCEDEGTLMTRKLNIRSSGNVSGEEKVIQWTFERSGTSGSLYYLKAAYTHADYYLAVSNGALTTVTDQGSATVFTASLSGTQIILESNSSYINITGNAPTLDSSVALSLYEMPSGSGATVIFDGQFGNPTYMNNGNHSGTYYKWKDNEKIETTADENGYVTLPASLETGSSYYPMKVNAWYDIINGVYYDNSMLGQQVKVTSDTIFYPEWVAETYDIGRNIDVVQNQPNTSDFITTKVFDYNELFNVHSCYYDETDDSWYFDPDSELGFIFFDYIQPTGNIGYMYDKDSSVDGVTVNVEKTAGSRGSSVTFPGTITTGIATPERIEALFGEDDIIGRQALGEGDWLYTYDEESGFYYYNSATNAASYNQSEQRFYVYDYTVNIDGPASLNDFVPFNYITDHGQGHTGSGNNTVTDDNTVYCEKGNQVNYWFGMSSSIEFYLPEDSGSGNNYSAHGDDMQFRFSGDDDVWVFIDGELVLDLGGVHDVVYGEINFSTGLIKTGQAFSSSEVANNTAESYAGMPGVEEGTPAGVTVTELPTLEGGKEHTLTIYYLERGSSLSNCAIYFNLSPAYELEITKSDKNGNIYLANAQFEIFNDPECTEHATLYEYADDGTLVEITGTTFVTNEEGVLHCFGLLAGKKYYIKEVLPPSGYPDMSKFVIEVDLNAEGEPVYVIIDSNKEPWVYADAFIVSSDAQHRIELSVYNDTYIGGDETTSVYAEKVWGEGSTDIPGEIDVMLYANGLPTSRTLKLNAENGWKGFFYELPLRDSNGNVIEYTAKEYDVPYGYTPSYEETVGQLSTTVNVPAHFRQVTSLQDGYYYRFVVASSGMAIQGTSGSSVESAAVNEEDDAQLWLAVSYSNGYFLLQNKAYPSRYLSIARSYWSSGVTTSTSTSSNNVRIALDNSTLKSSSSRYLVYESDGSFTTTSSVSSASVINTYEWVEASSTTEVTDISGWKVTNTPWDKLNIPVEKIWDEMVPLSERTPVEFELYLVTENGENTPTFITSLTLNDENGWCGTFENLEYPGETGYYCIVERSDTYTVTHSGTTAHILIGDLLYEATVVNIDTSGNAATVQITNSLLYLLPDTGGAGSLMLMAFGLILVIPSGILLAYQYRVKRKEDN